MPPGASGAVMTRQVQHIRGAIGRCFTGLDGIILIVRGRGGQVINLVIALGHEWFTACRTTKFG